MSYCRKEGKDQIIFITKDDHQKMAPPANPLMPDDDTDAVGLIKENGEINWDCPCLQGMADGPCGEQFKGAFACFHYSEAEPKGVDCIEQFKSMQECFVKYPEIYGSLDDDLDENENTTSETREITETDNQRDAQNDELVPANNVSSEVTSAETKHTEQNS